MACTISDIPAYLHYNGNRKIFKESSFKRKNPLYRTGNSENENPINFPFASTSISVCWDRLIELKDVLGVIKAHNPKTMDNHVYFGYPDEIKNHLLEDDCQEGIYKGKHVLKAIIRHSPEKCNYSHSEILIQHSYFENDMPKTVVLEHKDWDKSLFKKVKSSQKAFFKNLDLQYRAKMALLLRNDSSSLKKLPFSKIISKRLIFRIWFRYRLLIWRR